MCLNDIRHAFILQEILLAVKFYYKLSSSKRTVSILFFPVRYGMIEQSGLYGK